MYADRSSVLNSKASTHTLAPGNRRNVCP